MAPKTSAGQASGLCIRFTIPQFATKMGSGLAVVGSLPFLGDWKASGALPLTWSEGHRWSGDMELPQGWTGTIEFKVGGVIMAELSGRVPMP